MSQHTRFNSGTSTTTDIHSSGFAMTTLAAIILVACVMSSAPAVAQGAASSAISTGVGNPYKACDDGTRNEDRATCLKEAGAAKLEAQRGNLTTPAAAADQNALQRCDALPASDKEACRLRIMGAGTTSGSVAGGGVIREVVTVVPSAPVPRIPLSSSMPMATPMPMQESAPSPVSVVPGSGK